MSLSNRLQRLEKDATPNDSELIDFIKGTASQEVAAKVNFYTSSSPDCAHIRVKTSQQLIAYIKLQENFPKPDKPIEQMTDAELDAYERKLPNHPQALCTALCVFDVLV